MPCTTPASQLGILHGTCDGVPAFRWYDRELGRVVVGSRPADAAMVEKRASNGRGLLADGGVSVSNIFSGDAPRSLMTMSKIEVSRGSRDTRRVFAWFAVRPDGFARSVTRTVTEVLREGANPPGSAGATCGPECAAPGASRFSGLSPTASSAT